MVSSTKLFLIHSFFYYKLHLGSRMCKIMVVKCDSPIIIGKLQLVLKMCKDIMHYCIH